MPAALSHHAEAKWRQRAALSPSEAHEIWIARYDSATEAYVNNDPSDPCSRGVVYAATLYGLGFRNSELRTELRYREEQRHNNGHKL